MANKKLNKIRASQREALENFNLEIFKKWIKDNNPSLYKSFSRENKEIQMGTMCKCICNRTDMLGTDAHKKAVKWLAEHNMRGMLF